jgi:hypothetical protein
MGAVDLTRLREQLNALIEEAERLRVMQSAVSKIRALLSALDVIEEARSVFPDPVVDLKTNEDCNTNPDINP